MANAFLKPTVIINTILGMLQSELVLPHFVWKDGLGDFGGKYNDTITIRIPQPTIAHTRKLRATGQDRLMQVSDLTETSVDVRLTDVVYNLIALTDEERELDVHSFGVDVLPRQVRSVSEKLEAGVAATIVDAPYQQVHTAAVDAIYNAVIHARRQLNDAFVPREGRVLLVGSAVEEALLLDDRFVRYDSAGQAGADRLTNARIGRLAGYDVVVVDTIPHGAAFLFHPTAFVLVTRAPGKPFSNNVAVSTVGSENGIGLRWLGDYDSQITTDRSLVDTWAGYKAVVDPDPGFVRAARIQLAATSVAIGNKGDVAVGATRALSLVDSNLDNRAGDSMVTWVSDTPAKATVDANGVVTGVAAGTAKITATIGSVTDNYTITVA
ncbi:P22 coat protein-gene protein 5 [Mycobacteroides abscessus subsp. massiliense]|uniref:P22 phage major capsid protein family protein n=1 Tax=Mycobacteroides abscessus TaxID=36809 RepID=UPI0009A7EECD|nr:Ig-like domain-containing protein [Mycobacteroides abscessus]SKY04116.1 P22 coat protein-gene protein 5 [Mycobacteroides abscessus subsp. massiliense]SKZ06226.1 P22 coat protein-gene protein 5 [Mycobacteroides abscessus subsp. massiliense]